MEKDHTLVHSAHVEASNTIEAIDPEISACVRRKFDLRIVPALTLLYLFAQIDRYDYHFQEMDIRWSSTVPTLAMLESLVLGSFIITEDLANRDPSGMAKDLELTGDRFNIGLSAFFVTYIVLEV
jgi:hypothetical protein